MKVAFLLLLVGCCTLTFFLGYGCQHRIRQGNSAAPVILHRITALGTLDAAMVEIASVRETQLSGYAGAGRLLLVLRGRAVIGVDLTQARLQRHDLNRPELTILLPQPRVTLAAFDARQSRVYRIDRSGLWQLRPDDQATAELVNRSLLDAQQAVEAGGNDPAAIEATRSLVETLLSRLAAEAGSTLRIQWADH